MISETTDTNFPTTASMGTPGMNGNGGTVHRVAQKAHEAVDKLAFAYVPVVAKEEVSAPFERGYVTAELLQRRTPDYLERTWYISGPPGMVNAYSNLLRDLDVPRKQIKKDFFPGAV